MALTHSAYLLSLIEIALLTLTQGQLNVPKELAAEKVGAEKAGVKARLSEQGVHHVTSFLTNILIGELGKAKGLEIEPKKLTDKVTLLPGELRAHNPSREVRLQLLSPKNIALEIPSISFSTEILLNGDLEISGDTPLSSAKVEIQLPSGQLRLNLTLLKNAHGSPATQLGKCSLEMNSNPLFLRYNSPVTTAQKQKLDDLLRAKAPEFLDSMLCAHVNYVVEDRVNQRFGILSNKVSLTSANDDQLVEDLRTTRRRTQRTSKVRSARETSNSTIFHTFDVVGGRAATLMLDYTLTAEPRTSPLGVELECTSEVSLHGRGGTPFGPASLQLPETTHEGSMLQMAVSDFVPNSLMYHGHTMGLFNTRIDPTTQHFGSIMRTSCTVESGLLFCMGDFFPTLKRLHPNLGLVLSFTTIESPVIKFHPQSVGGIEFHLRGKIAMSLLPMDNIPANITQETVVALMGIEVAAHMRLRLSSTKVKPKVTFDKLKLTTLSPGILVQGELDDAVVLAKEVLQRMVNEVLREGIPLPVHPLFRLNKPKVKVQERAILLQTNLNLNEGLMLKLMSQDF